MTHTLTWQTLCSETFELGESPFWHPHEQMLYWVDITAKEVLRANVYMGTVEHWRMPSEPGCIAPAASGGLVLALRHGVFRARQWGGALEHITTLDYDTASVRANDGKCDAAGRLWVGTYDESKSNNAAGLYSIDCRNGQTPTVTCHASKALGGNGLAWNPDGSVLYWADTPRHMVHAWDFEAHHGTLAAQRTYLQFAAKPGGWTYQDARYQGRPDGAAVDVHGNYYCAMYEGRLVCKFSPDGVLLAEIPTPAQCPTMPCFGGEDLKTVYLTSARHGRSAAELETFPLSGSVFSMRVDTPGLPVNFFRD
jgi:sugar lactone lactonase YvrE